MPGIPALGRRAARGRQISTMKDGTAQKISNALLSGAAGVASFIFSLTAFLYITSFNEQIAGLDRRRRLLPADQLHRLRTAQQRKRPRPGRAWRPAAGRRAGRPHQPDAALVRECMPKLATAVDSLFAEVRASIENAHALGMYDPVTSLPNRLHFRAEADKLLGARPAGDQVGDAVRRPRPLQERQRQPRPCPRRPAADHGRQPAARRRHRRTGRGHRSSGRCWPGWPATSSPCSSREIDEVADVERVARRIALAISEPFELHGHSIDIGASVGVAVSPITASIEALMRAADIAMYRAKHARRRAALPVQRRAGRRASAQDRNRDGAERSGPARRIRARLPAAAEPRHRRGQRRRGAAALEPSARRHARCRHLHSDRRADRDHRRHRRLGDRRSRLDAGRWQPQGIKRRLAFNVSPRQLDRADFFHADAGRPSPTPACRCRWSSWNSPKPPRWNAREAVLAEIAALRADGASIAIDDFGTGYSNIARLRSMPLDRVKLDPSLIADIETSEKARVVVQAVDPADQGRRRRRSSPRRSRLSPRPTSCAPWAATPSRASSSPSRCSRKNISTWTRNADRGLAQRRLGEHLLQDAAVDPAEA